MAKVNRLSIRTFIEKHQLLLYFVLAYALAWIFLPPSYQSLLHSPKGGFPLIALIGLLGAYSPALASIILTAILGGKPALKILFKRLVDWRISAKWYLFVFLVPLVLFLISIWFSTLSGFTLGAANFQSLPVAILSSIAIALPFGPLGEEAGWRGFALPRLQEKFSPMVSSLILGLLWGLWHIPAFQFPGAAIPSVFAVNALTILLFLLNIIGSTLLLTAVYNRTRGSLLIAVIFHTMIDAKENILISVFPGIGLPTQQEMVYFVNIILMLVLGVSMILLQNPSTTRESIRIGRSSPDTKQV